MRELASCLGEHAVQVSDTSCSNYRNNPCISPNSSAASASVQNSVTCLYRATLSSAGKQMTIAVTWSKTATSHGLAINFDDDPSAAFKITTNSRLFRKSKGSRSLHLRSSKIEIHWDLSAARYHPGPEPLDNYHVSVAVDSEPALTLGDGDRSRSGAKFALISRQERHFSGSNQYSTKARFSDAGGAHDISIRCSGEGGGEGAKHHHPVLSVSIDKKMVIRVKKLQWNFRGNQTIFLDGLLVDLMWDVHDWFYNNNNGGDGDSGNAVFMFRTRSGLDSRLWIMEENPKVQDNHLDFSFMIYACKHM